MRTLVSLWRQACPPRPPLASAHRPHRLYFTTFPHPPPGPHVLNNPSSDSPSTPRVRARPRGGPSASPDDDATYYYFTIDDQLLYLSFFQDWGPLNLAMVYKACILIHELLEVRTASSGCAPLIPPPGQGPPISSPRPLFLGRPTAQGKCRTSHGALCRTYFTLICVPFHTSSR